ncbi:transporter [Leifsonia sp. NPDC014704]|uniref:transporter n=1 Tax=Leifsonia sp. NPDC014704 TaxID=3364123 RepID=UPI0036F46EEB
MTLSRPGVPDVDAERPRTTVLLPRGARRGVVAWVVRLWPGATALTFGCVAAIAMLGIAAGTEFPLFSEASAERGRDCTTIRSARHALDAALDAHLAALGAHPVEAGSAIQDAVTRFRAETSDIATDAVARALDPVDRTLDELRGAVDGRTFARDPGAALAAANAAAVQLRGSWDGPLARVCD